MRIRTILVSFALFLLISSNTAQEIRVVETGSFHGDEVAVADGEIWLGIYKRNDSFMLMPSILSVESVYDAIIDSVGESSGTSITVPGMGEPLFLLKGGGFEEAKPVPTLEHLIGEIDPRRNLTFEFGGRRYRIWMESGEKSDDEFVKADSKLIFSMGATKQVLYEVKECSFCRWRIDWIGDIDSDGKPDLYLYLTHHYNVRNQKLFLSSKAGNGKLVKEVAEFTSTGC